MMRYTFSVLICLLGYAIACKAQTNPAGTWQGALNMGTANLRLVLHITDEGGGKFSGKMDSPDQGAMGIPVSDVHTTGDSVYIEVKSARLLYGGRFMDASHITGAMQQNGMTLPLDIAKGEKLVERNRPQTPKPPFDYNSDDVIYFNADSSIQYGATITAPKGKGPFPAVLLITGSGLQNRDEEIMEHKPFAVIADYLTKHGYIVMRVDDRGKGLSTGDIINATTADFAKDVNVSFNYLLSRKGVDKKKAGLMGHSEGGEIAEMVAADRKDVDFIVLMAGPGEKISKLMEEQNAALLINAGVSDFAVQQYGVLYRNLEQALIGAKDADDAKNHITHIVHEWRTKTNDQIVTSTSGMSDDQSEKKYVQAFAAMYSIPWYRYFIASDPQPYIRKLSCKVLAINGDKDIQVVAAGNLQGLRESLAKSKSKQYDVVALKGLNHLFQECKTCSVSEYGDLEQTMSPVALQTMSDWMDKYVKK